MHTKLATKYTQVNLSTLTNKDLAEVIGVTDFIDNIEEPDVQVVPFIKYDRDYETQDKSLFLGEELGLVDTIHKRHPKIWELYKLMKSLDWDENEFDYSVCNSEFKSVPEYIKDMMIETLTWQWEADSAAAMSVYGVTAPFVSSTELTALWVEISKNECLTGDHEVLTDNGWVRLDSFTPGSKVFQWDYDTHAMTLVEPEKIIIKKYSGIMYHFLSVEGNLSQIVTPKHRMPVMYKVVNPYKKKKKAVLAKDCEYDSSNGIPVIDFNGSGKTVFLSGDKISKSEVEYTGHVYCLTVPSGYFVVRHYGCVSVTGNCLHSLTYSEIVRNSFDDPSTILKTVLENKESLKRIHNVYEVFEEVHQLGAMLVMGFNSKSNIINREAILKFVITLLCLERIQFMASFAITFAIAELGYFVPIAKAVQKICNDEFQVHVTADKEILHNELSTELGKEAYSNIRSEVEGIIGRIVESELAWTDHLFREGRELPGVNKEMIKDWVYYAATDVYQFLKLDNPFKVVSKNPLTYMNDWIDINNNQPSPQEEKVGNYLLGRFQDDADKVVFEVDF